MHDATGAPPPGTSRTWHATDSVALRLGAPEARIEGSCAAQALDAYVHRDGGLARHYECTRRPRPAICLEAVAWDPGTGEEARANVTIPASPDGRDLERVQTRLARSPYRCTTYHLDPFLPEYVRTTRPDTWPRHYAAHEAAHAAHALEQAWQHALEQAWQAAVDAYPYHPSPPAYTVQIGLRNPWHVSTVELHRHPRAVRRVTLDDWLDAWEEQRANEWIRNDGSRARYHVNDKVDARIKTWVQLLKAPDARKHVGGLGHRAADGHVAHCALGVGALACDATPETAHDGTLCYDGESRQLSRAHAQALDILQVGTIANTAWVRRADGAIETRWDEPDNEDEGHVPIDDLITLSDDPELDLSMRELGEWIEEHYDELITHDKDPRDTPL